MTRLRRLAMKVSCGVVRLAPPEAREWARATAREIEFIESDWAALGWALGGLRILWQPSEHRLASQADVPQAARQFAKEIRKRTVIGCAACIYLDLLAHTHRPGDLESGASDRQLPVDRSDALYGGSVDGQTRLSVAD